MTATITWNEPVSGFVSGDVTLGGGTAGAFTVVSTTQYTLAITAGGSGTTTVDIDVAAAVCADAAGNVSAAAAGQAAIAYAPWASSTGSDAYGVWADLSVTGNGETAVQRLRLIAPATFTMGSPVTEAGRNWGGAAEHESLHLVTISTPYWIADSECTQRMWKAVMNTTPSWFTAAGLDLPVEQVNFAMVQSFLTDLNLVKSSLSARLPTESEWEYAARAGTTTPFSISPVIVDHINCCVYTNDPYFPTGPMRNQTVVVKSLRPNPWGLYEVHGNVMEWCSDWWQDDWGSATVIDPTGPTSGSDRAIRGGDWANLGQNSRSGFRGALPPAGAYSNLGFRFSAPGWPSGGG